MHARCGYDCAGARKLHTKSTRAPYAQAFHSPTATARTCPAPYACVQAPTMKRRRGSKSKKSGDDPGATPAGTPTDDLAAPTPAAATPADAATAVNCQVGFAVCDKGAGSIISGLTASNGRTFASLRATHGVARGCWYCEFTIGSRKNARETCNVRVGLASAACSVAMPVGADAQGYAVRDVNGAKVHAGVRREFMGEPLALGDVVGLLVQLAPAPRAGASSADEAAASAAPRWLQQHPAFRPDSGVQHLYDVQLSKVKELAALLAAERAALHAEAPASPFYPDMPNDLAPSIAHALSAARVAPGMVHTAELHSAGVHSYLRVFVNGQDKGIPFVNLAGTSPHRPATDVHYFPTAALLNGAAVTLNPGPAFKHAPPRRVELSPTHTLAEDWTPWTMAPDMAIMGRL